MQKLLTWRLVPDRPFKYILNNVSSISRVPNNTSPISFFMTCGNKNKIFLTPAGEKCLKAHKRLFYAHNTAFKPSCLLNTIWFGMLNQGRLLSGHLCRSVRLNTKCSFQVSTTYTLRGSSCSAIQYISLIVFSIVSLFFYLDIASLMLPYF